MKQKQLIDLYPYRMTHSGPEFLLLKRAEGKIYQGQWRMIGGKVEPGETYWQAALRELKEETGLVPKRFWTIPGVNSFYEHKTDQIHLIPAFAAEIEAEEQPVLDNEHSEAGWMYAEKAIISILWPEQKRLIKLTNKLIISDQILEDWHVPIT